MRTLLFTVLAAVTLASLGQAPTAEVLAAEGEITIAVRKDARPFIWKDPDTGEYLGFFWDICTEAAQRANYRVKVKEIGAKERKSFLSTGVEDYDLLCDPTTITLKRLKNFTDEGEASHLAFSPIVFVSNGTYVEQDRSAKGLKSWGLLGEEAPASIKDVCDGLEEWLKDIPAIAGKDTLAPAGELAPPSWVLPSKEAANATGDAGRQERWISLRARQNQNDKERTYQIWGYVSGSTIGEAVQAWAEQSQSDDESSIICPWALGSHEEAAKFFCAGWLYRYFGDADIVRAALDDRKRQGGSCVAHLTPTAGGTYEPYAFVISEHPISGLPERIALALYGMFEDGTVERLFAGHFPDTQKSQFLSTLFRINSIPAGTDAPESP